MKIYIVKLEIVQCDWFVVDVVGQILGCLVIEIVCCLCGKYKFEYILYVDIGDYIVVINVEQVCVIGVKIIDKMYYYYFGFLGGIKLINFEKLIVKVFECVIEIVVKGMLLKNFLGCDMYCKLKVYKGVSYLYIVQ